MIRYAFANPRFESLGDAICFLLDGLIEENRGRYRHSNTVNDVESILFVFQGKFLEEILVDRVVEPTRRDKRLWEVTRKVYLTTQEPRLFRRFSVRASSVGLKGLQYGKRVSDEVYAKIIEKTRGFMPLH